MAYLAHTCPVCQTHKIPLRIVYAEGAQLPSHPSQGFIWWRCPGRGCTGAGSALISQIHNSSFSPSSFVGNDNEVSKSIKIHEFWPAVEAPNAPRNLPSNIERAFLQGEDNFPKPGNTEAAGAMYGRAIELTLKTIDPESRGSLDKRIRKAADNGKLTSDIADWAHSIRVLRNESLHDVDGINVSDLKQVRGITEMILRYVFTLPGMVAELREEVEIADDAKTTD